MQGLLCLDLRGLAQEQSGEQSGKDGQLYLAGLESLEQLEQRHQPTRHYFPETLHENVPFESVSSECGKSLLRLSSPKGGCPPIMRELVSKVRLRPAMASNGCYILAVARIGFLNLIWEAFWASQNPMGNH
jgi:hypothetical protein